MVRWLAAVLIGMSIMATPAHAADPTEIGIGYLGTTGIKPKLSLVEQPAENDGIAGARLGDRGQQHHRQVPQPALQAGGSAAQGE